MARDEYLDHVAGRTWKLDVLDAEESRLSLINDRKNNTESDWQVVDRHSSKSATSGKATDDSKTRHWRNEPPKSGDSHTRSHKNGRTGEAGARTAVVLVTPDVGIRRTSPRITTRISTRTSSKALLKRNLHPPCRPKSIHRRVTFSCLQP